MKESKIWSFLGSNIISLATIFSGLIVVILDLLEILPDSITYSVILAVLTLLATSEIIESRGKLSKIGETLDGLSNQITEITQGIQTIEFDKSEEAHEYVLRKTRQASISIDQASLDYFRSGARKTKARENYAKERKKTILSDRVKYRYLGTLYNARRLHENYDYVINNQLKKFFVAFYPKPQNQIPLLTFIIFDNEEVFVRPPYELNKGSKYFVIKSPDVVQLFLRYFDKLWEKSQKFENEDDYKRLANIVEKS